MRAYGLKILLPDFAENGVLIALRNDLLDLYAIDKTIYVLNLECSERTAYSRFTVGLAPRSYESERKQPSENKIT